MEDSDPAPEYSPKSQVQPAVLMEGLPSSESSRVASVHQQAPQPRIIYVDRPAPQPQIVYIDRQVPQPRVVYVHHRHRTNPGAAAAAGCLAGALCCTIQ